MLPSTLIPLVAVLARCGPGLARSNSKILSTWPTQYSGEPSGDYSSEWQSCESCRRISFPYARAPEPFFVSDFQVTDSLPGVDFTLPNNYAGNINVNRSGHPNDTLFFWGFEHAEGSLTAAAGANDSVPWAIWLQGGCVYAVYSCGDVCTQ